MTQPITVLVNGAFGRMGALTVAAINRDEALTCVGQLGRQDDLKSAIQKTHPDVVVDFTEAKSVYKNAQIIVEAHVHPVVGTSGLLPTQIETLTAQCAKQQLGGIIAPNFSIGTVLMMKLAKEAAKIFPNVEIIEYHHAQKKDAPSGTAIKTAEMIASARLTPPNTLESHETIAGSRGGKHHDIPIHAVRLPGLVAHQEIIFGDNHELLTLRHDAFDRAAFMPGVLLAVKKVIGLHELIYGLEKFI